MFNIVIYAVVSIIVCIAILFLITITYKSSIRREKNRPFERGFEPTGGSRLQFCMKFFLVGVIFLIFDVEVRLILPLPFSQTYVLLFFIVLLAGLAYEWFYGGLDWLYVNGCFLRCSWDYVKRKLTHYMNNNRSQSHIVSTYYRN